MWFLFAAAICLLFCKAQASYDVESNDLQRGVISSCFVGLSVGSNFTTGAVSACSSTCTIINILANGYVVKLHACVNPTLCEVFYATDNCTGFMASDQGALSACCCTDSNNCNSNLKNLPTPQPAVSEINCYNGLWINGLSSMVPGEAILCGGECAAITVNDTSRGALVSITLYTCYPSSVCRELGFDETCPTILNETIGGCCCSEDMCIDPTNGRYSRKPSSIASTGASLTPSNDCPNGWIQAQFNSKCYYSADSTPRAWFSALTACRALHPLANLVSIQNAFENSACSTMRLLLAVLCPLSLAALCSADPKLVHLQTLYRHGDRTPTGTYKNDPYQQSFWGLPWGELTTWGMQQHWTQGKKIKARYTDQLKFLNATYSSTQVSVRSVESPRCLVSALSNIAATYTDSKDTFPNVQGWPSNWTPIPIATYLEKTDHIINSDAECLRLDELYVERVAKKGFIEFIMSKAGLLTTITQGAGESIADIKGLKNFFDAVYIEKVCYNLTLPAWITDDLFNEAEDTLMQGEDYVYGLDGFDEPENTEIIMLRGGGLLAEMIANMQSVISGSGRLYHAYSSHDTMVSAFLNALGAKRGAIGPKNPDYASTVAVELWKDDGGKYLVKLWYSDNALTDLRDITKYISGCGGGDYCSWDDFVARSQQYVHTDIEKQCNKL